MPKRISRPSDINQLAYQLVQESTEEKKKQPEQSKLSKSEISRVMAEMRRKGGKKGGKRRMETIYP
jgi:hypothetical protein